MKRFYGIIAAVLCAALVFTVFSPVVSDFCGIKLYAVTQSGACGDNATYKLESGVLTISGTGSTDQSYLISNVPWDRNAVEEIVIEEGITEISGGTFVMSKNLKKVSIASSVKNIDVRAFAYCTSLESISIPEGVEKIWSEAFHHCTSLKSIYIPKSVTYIECNPFAKCPQLSEIRVHPENETYHSEDNCLILTDEHRLIAGGKNSVIPSDGSVTTIDPWAFDGSSITEMIIPESITKVCYLAFNDCDKLEKVTLPSGISEIDDDTFAGCASLKSIDIPNMVTSIGNRAFDGCKSLHEITISKNVTEIRGNPFTGCSGLESIIVDPNNPYYGSVNNCLVDIKGRTLIAGCKTSVIPSDGYVVKIADSAFYGCSTLTEIEIPEEVVSIGLSSFYKCIGLKNITLSNGLKKIGGNAFLGCSALTEIVIPASVTEIGARPFAYCSKLSSIKVQEDNTKYHSSGNCLIETESGTLIAGCNESVIPSDGSVTIIGRNAFQGCKELRNVHIPETIETVEVNAFYECEKLSELYISSGVKSIENQAFYRCSNIFDIYYEGTEEEWNDLVASGAVSDLKGTTVHYSYDPSIPLPDAAGDINSDGEIDTKDLTRLMKRISVDAPIEVADVNGDGKVNTKDLTRLMKYIAGETVELY